jgi:hypothetical protein
MAWTDEDVEAWLNDWPLPADFTWKGERVWPRYALKHGYGQWLRTAGSYHPALQGLFRLACQVIQGLPVGTPMPTPAQLVLALKKFETVQEALPIGDVVANDTLQQPMREAWPAPVPTP